MFKRNIKDARILLPLLLTANIFLTLFFFSLVNFEHVIAREIILIKLFSLWYDLWEC